MENKLTQTENDAAEKIREKLEEAELILVGIGREMDSFPVGNTEKENEEKENETDGNMAKENTPKENTPKENTDSIKDYIINEIMQGMDRKEDENFHDRDFYDRCASVYDKLQKKITNPALCNLAKLLQGKNYFLLSTNVDECLYQSGFKEGRVLTPCGRETLFQCSENCNDSVWEANTYLQSLFQNGSMAKEEDREFPVCPSCKKRAVFNMIKTGEQKKYCEKGYLQDWERYKKWLSGTLNKKLLLLDLGTDFYQPQLIRQAFEKTAFLNQKSYLIRVQETFSHVPKELGERAAAFSVNSKKLFEQWRL